MGDTTLASAIATAALMFLSVLSVSSHRQLRGQSKVWTLH